MPQKSSVRFIAHSRPAELSDAPHLYLYDIQCGLECVPLLPAGVSLLFRARLPALPRWFRAEAERRG